MSIYLLLKFPSDLVLSSASSGYVLSVPLPFVNISFYDSSAHLADDCTTPLFSPFTCSISASPGNVETSAYT